MFLTSTADGLTEACTCVRHTNARIVATMNVRIIEYIFECVALRDVHPSCARCLVYISALVLFFQNRQISFLSSINRLPSTDAPQGTHPAPPPS